MTSQTVIKQKSRGRRNTATLYVTDDDEILFKDQVKTKRFLLTINIKSCPTPKINHKIRFL